MLFLNRERELGVLAALAKSRSGGLAVITGRRRVGKTRLLLEWLRQTGGIYFVADESSAALQRRYFAEAVERRLPGFGQVEYRDWRSLLSRLAQDARQVRFRGPIVLDELPYLVAASPELPSVLQQWIDHEAADAGLAVALSGSSQRMMQGLVLDADAPLYGRARVSLVVEPLSPRWLARAFPGQSTPDRLLSWTAWGGVPRYWELAQGLKGSVLERIVSLVLDPMGPLHLEPERLLLEETPSAADLRPLLDAMGGGAHRVSEIAARIGRPATSLSRALERLQGLGLVAREVPFGVPARDTKRSLYRLVDPFLRLWFRMVAPHRGTLAVATPAQRLRLLQQHLPGLMAQSFEDLSRRGVCALGEWAPAGRWWQGSAPEWDVVSRAADGQVLVGEAKAWLKPGTRLAVTAEARRISARALPALGGDMSRVVRALFVPSLARGVPREVEGVRLVTWDDLVQAV